jgi:hypothetical protein
VEERTAIGRGVDTPSRTEEIACPNYEASEIALQEYVGLWLVRDLVLSGKLGGLHGDEKGEKEQQR